MSGGKGKKERPRRRPLEPERAVVGLEAEFACVVDGDAVDPVKVFGDPRAFLGPSALHRTGTSYHLPTGGAVYFDTGVIEVVTPVIELGPAAASRVVRSLWEGIMTVRERLDEWSEREGREARLVGFSAHYNVSLPELRDQGHIADVARLLTDILPLPVTLFAANRRSTGVGLRPRPGRVEVTVDFTPDAALMAAATAIVIAAVVEVATWSRSDRGEVSRQGFALLRDFEPIPHTSRKGWLAHASCFDPDPFRGSPDHASWTTVTGERVSVRRVARIAVARLIPRIRAAAAPETMRVIGLVLTRRLPSLLDLPDRPAAYEDVGRLCLWEEPDPDRPLDRSLYEQVMRDAMAGRPILVDGRSYRPVGTSGWTRVRYRDRRGNVRTFSVDELARLKR